MHALAGLFADLNPAQREAVEAGDGPALVLAGPGSGKTRVLTHRVAFLAGSQHVPPYRIFTVTFTNKAAREMTSRLEDLLGQAVVQQITIGTFHAICARLLRREADHLPVSRDYQIFDDSDQLSLIGQIIKDMNLDEGRYQSRAVLSAISRAKSEMILPKRYHAHDYWHEVVGRIYDRYADLLLMNNALDFDDLLLETVLLLQSQPTILSRYQERYRYLLVDEFQDTNIVQYELLKLLAASHRNLFVVGDEDQSIYRFRGADFRNVARFRRDFPDARVVLLEHNYRSTQIILDVADAIIAHNPNRTPKRLHTERGPGAKVTLLEKYDGHEEAEFVVREIDRLVSRGQYRPGDCAVMYRTNAQSRSIEDAFVRVGKPYRLVGATRFYARKEIKDVLAYLRLIHNPLDSVSFGRIVNMPPRGIGQRTLADLSNWAARQELPLFLALRRLLSDDSEPSVTDPPRLASRSLKALATFSKLLDQWGHISQSVSVLQLLDLVLEESGYADYVRDGSEAGTDRWANIMELRTVAHGYEELEGRAGLTAFLEEVSLVSDLDGWEESSDAPTLLTLHMAKGLEFAVVFIVGLEEKIFPHSRCMDEPEELAEERRLFFVGVTRAKDQLYLIHTFRRTLFGMEQINQPSRFIREIPAALISRHAGPPQERRPSFSGLSAETQTEQPARRGKLPARVRQAHSTYAAGDKVEHPAFGTGTVISSQVVGQDEELLVAFAGKGIKRLSASIAPLQKQSP